MSSQLIFVLLNQLPNLTQGLSLNEGENKSKIKLLENGYMESMDVPIKSYYMENPAQGKTVNTDSDLLF